MAKKKQINEMDLPALEREHSALSPVAQRFCEAIVQQLGKLFADEGIALAVPIQHRVKQWASLAEKFERVQLQVTTVKEVQDLAGLRIILLFKRDVETVCNLISKNFNIVHQYDTQERLKDDQFGYSSRHFIVELPKGWLAVPTLSDLAGLQAEIQVRTLAQHAWAEISHKLQYKQEASVPPVVRRAIYRASALLEMIDLEFERVLDEREAYRSKFNIAEPDEPLNVDLIEKVLDSLLPAENKGDDEPYDQLLHDLAFFDVTNSKGLKTLIQKHLDAILETETRFVEFHMLDGGCFSHVGLVRIALRLEFGKGFAAYEKALLWLPSVS